MSDKEMRTMPERKTVFAYGDATELIAMARRYADQLEKCLEILLDAPANAVDCPGGPGLHIPPGPYRIVLAHPLQQEGEKE